MDNINTAFYKEIGPCKLVHYLGRNGQV